MSYEFPVDHRALIEERAGQFLSFGLPREDLDELRGSIDSVWADVPGGWTYEWSRLAAKYAAEGTICCRRWCTGSRSSRSWPTSRAGGHCRTRLSST